MKRGRVGIEGWLIGAALLALLALAALTAMDRQPRAQSAGPVHFAPREALEAAERIDLNAAGAERLDELPGIGPALAEAIIAYRQEHGPFTDVEQLDEVPGIGPAKLEAVRPYVRLE